LLLSYSDFGQHSANIHNNISFFECASFSSEDNGDITKFSLHVGDVVTLQEEDEKGDCYAIIRHIFRHKNNNNKFYAFISLDWFEKISQETSMECPIYRIQAKENKKWRRIYPITIIGEVEKVHFIHQCYKNCTNNHDLSNKQYYKNEFFMSVV
jgi:hypothetical protein